MHYRVERQLVGGGIHVLDTPFYRLEQIQFVFSLPVVPKVGDEFTYEVAGHTHTYKIIQWGAES